LSKVCREMRFYNGVDTMINKDSQNQEKLYTIMELTWQQKVEARKLALISFQKARTLQEQTIVQLSNNNSLEELKTPLVKEEPLYLKDLNEIRKPELVSLHLSGPGMHFSFKIRPEVMAEYLKRDKKSLDVGQHMALLNKISAELKKKKNKSDYLETSNK
jgi:hypothetical protein